MNPMAGMTTVVAVRINSGRQSVLSRTRMGEVEIQQGATLCMNPAEMEIADYLRKELLNHKCKAVVYKYL